MVGTTSMMWRNWSRRPPLSEILAGQVTVMFCRIPPSCEAICFIHGYGVSKAQVQPTAMWL